MTWLTTPLREQGFLRQDFDFWGNAHLRREGEAMKSVPLILVLAAACIIAGYVGAYLGMGFRVDWKAPSGATGTIERTYTSKWATTVFAPAARAETMLRGVLVHPVYVSHGYQQRLQKRNKSSVPISSSANNSSVGQP
jgi:hypothetical protein